MRVALLTREFPPDVYGGAGVHVEYLARELRAFDDLEVHAWGDDREGVVGHRAWEALDGEAPHLAALRTMSIDLSMTAGVANAELVHSHTWYANLAGHLAKLTYDIPHVATIHSLEPMRPWKAEQLGGGYQLSLFCERTGLEGADAVIAVSEGMRRDVLAAYPGVDPDRVHVVYNGIDAEEYRPDPGTEVLERHGVDPGAPSVVFVGRITRQKGVPYLVEAALEVDRVNLEAMACETAVVASAVGGIVEVVVDGETGLLVPLEIAEGSLEPRDREAFVRGLADGINALVRDPARAAEMGRAGRTRAVEKFAWPAIAEQTSRLYHAL
jgi:starch synthase